MEAVANGNQVVIDINTPLTDKTDAEGAPGASRLHAGCCFYASGIASLTVGWATGFSILMAAHGEWVLPVGMGLMVGSTMLGACLARGGIDIIKGE